EPDLFSGVDDPFGVDGMEEAAGGDPEGGIEVFAEGGDAVVLGVEIGIAVEAGAKIGESLFDIDAIGGLVVLAGSGGGEQHDGRLIGRTPDGAGAELDADGDLGQIVALKEEDLEAV